MPALFLDADPIGNALAVMAWGLVVVTAAAFTIVLLTGRDAA